MDRSPKRVQQINLMRSTLVVEEIMVQARLGTIIACQEPPFVRGRIPGVPRSASCVYHKSDTRPLAAIIMCGDSSDLMAHFHLCTETVAVASMGKNSIYIVSVYCPPKRPILPIMEHVERVIAEARGRIIICSDTNAWSPSWGSASFNLRGRILEQWMLRAGIICCNDPTSPPTFSGARGSSHIDLTLCTDRSSPLITRWKVRHDSSSDHASIYFNVLGTDYKATCNATTRKYGEGQADWGSFKACVADSLAQAEHAPPLGLWNEERVESRAEQIQNAILAAADECLPRRSYGRMPPKRWWNGEIKVARTVVNKARKNVRTSRNSEMIGPARLLCAKLVKAYREKIKKAKRESWRSFVADTTAKGPWGISYSIARSNPLNSMAFPAIPDEGIFPRTRSAAHRNTLSQLYGSDDPRTDNPEQEVIRQASSVPSGADFLPSWDEVDISLAIEAINAKGAPGRDGITGRMIKEIKDVLTPSLVELFNGCLEAGVFPKIWKQADVLLFTKKGVRDPMIAASYRPICLLPVMGKVLEMALKASLRPYIEAQLSDRQYGSRPGRSTEDAIAKIVQEAHDGRSSYCIMLNFDIAGAFDSAWWPAIFSALQDFDVPSNLFMILTGYLKERRARLFSSEEGEESFQVKRGCPQGSVLGPILWAALFNGVLRKLERHNISSVAYVDDLAVLVNGNSRRAVLTNAKDAAVLVDVWCRSNKLKIAVSKTSGCVLKGRFDDRHPPRIEVNGERIVFPASVTYLGVTFGPLFNMGPHICSLTSKVNGLLSTLLRLSGPTWGMDFSQVIAIFKACFYGVALYAVGAWGPLLRKGHVKALESLQRVLLIRITKAYRTVSGEALNIIAGIPPIDIKIGARIALSCKRKSRPIPVIVPQMLRDVLAPVPDGYDGLEEARNLCDMYVRNEWDRRWRCSSKGANTRRFFPTVETRIQAGWMKPNYRLTQFLSGHGDFLSYLHKFKRKDSPICLCGEEEETVEHVVLRCNRFAAPRIRMYREICNFDPDVKELVKTENNTTAFERFIKSWKEIKGSL